MIAGEKCLRFKRFEASEKCRDTEGERKMGRKTNFLFWKKPTQQNKISKAKRSYGARGKNESWQRRGGGVKRGRRGIGPGRSLPSFPVTHAAPLSPSSYTDTRARRVSVTTTRLLPISPKCSLSLFIQQTNTSNQGHQNSNKIKVENSPDNIVPWLNRL